MSPNLALTRGANHSHNPPTYHASSPQCDPQRTPRRLVLDIAPTTPAQSVSAVTTLPYLVLSLRSSPYIVFSAYISKLQPPRHIPLVQVGAPVRTLRYSTHLPIIRFSVWLSKHSLLLLWLSGVPDLLPSSDVVRGNGNSIWYYPFVRIHRLHSFSIYLSASGPTGSGSCSTVGSGSWCPISIYYLHGPQQSFHLLTVTESTV